MESRLRSGVRICLLAGLSSLTTHAVTIDHSAIPGVTNLPSSIMEKVGTLRWFFSHASVGGNMITGMNVLHESDTNRYRLAIYNYDGDNSDGAYHGGIGTTGSEGGSDYSAEPPPATTNGMIYECQRSNPQWDNKVICFSNSVTLAGWRYPRVNVSMDKFCWIDPDANPTQYCATVQALAARYPETLFVFLTMPLTTETAYSDNDARNIFNRYVRSYCTSHNKWLLDIADVEAWTTNGVQNTYLLGSVTNQRMANVYAQNAGGGDFHLTALGRRQAALAWYALAGALFQRDSDGDSMTDGDEMIAGTQAESASSRFVLTGSTHGSTNHIFTWTSASNRFYSIQATTNLASGTAWTNLATNLQATPPVNRYTTGVTSARSRYYRTAVQQ